MTRRIGPAEQWWRNRLHRHGPDTLRAVLDEAQADHLRAWNEARWQTLNRLRNLERAAAELDRCEICEGTGWARIPDPFFNGATTDQRCPACQDTTVRGARNCYELDNGDRIRPTGGLCQ